MNKKDLHSIKESGFKVPNDYFEDLEGTILSQAKLSGIEKSGHKIPEGYLDTLEETILSQVSKKETPKVIPLFTKRNIVYISSIAAAVLLLLNLSIFEKDNVNSLDLETVENYIIDEDISTYDIASLLTDEDLEESNYIETTFKEENVEDFIIDNLNIEDIESLYIE